MRLSREIIRLFVLFSVLAGGWMCRVCCFLIFVYFLFFLLRLYHVTWASVKTKVLFDLIYWSFSQPKHLGPMQCRGALFVFHNFGISVRVSKVLLIILWPCGVWSGSSHDKQDIGDVVTMLGDVCTGHMSPWYLGPVSRVPIVTAGQHQIGGVSPAHRVSVMHMGARRNIRGWHQHQTCVWKLDLKKMNVNICLKPQNWILLTKTIVSSYRLMSAAIGARDTGSRGETLL